MAEGAHEGVDADEVRQVVEGEDAVRQADHKQVARLVERRRHHLRITVKYTTHTHTQTDTLSLIYIASSLSPSQEPA